MATLCICCCYPECMRLSVCGCVCVSSLDSCRWARKREARARHLIARSRSFLGPCVFFFVCFVPLFTEPSETRSCPQGPLFLSGPEAMRRKRGKGEGLQQEEGTHVRAKESGTYGKYSKRYTPSQPGSALSWRRQQDSGREREREWSNGRFRLL